MKTILSIIFITTVLYTTAQPDNYILAEGNIKTNLEKEILSASKKTSSLQCNFIQEKSSVLLSEKSVSKGIMLYKTPNFLRWEYTEPNSFALILNGDNVYAKNEAGLLDNANKMFKQLGNLIINTINGNGLTDSKNFNVDYYINENDNSNIVVILIPIQKRMKEIFSSIQIKIETSDYLASEIVMNEKSGDATTIKLSNKKINIEIPENKFSVN